MEVANQGNSQTCLNHSVAGGQRNSCHTAPGIAANVSIAPCSHLQLHPYRSTFDCNSNSMETTKTCTHCALPRNSSGVPKHALIDTSGVKIQTRKYCVRE